MTLFLLKSNRSIFKNIMVALLQLHCKNVVFLQISKVNIIKSRYIFLIKHIKNTILKGS